MPISISRFRGQTGRITVEDGADKTLIVYRSGRTTPDWLDGLASRPLRTALAQLLVSWDVTGDDGMPLQPPAVTDPIWVPARRVAMLMAVKTTLEKRAEEAAAVAAETPTTVAPVAETLTPTPDPDIQVGVPALGKAKGRKAIPQLLRDTLEGVTLEQIVAELNTFNPLDLGLGWVGAVSVAGLQTENLVASYASGLTPTGELALDEDMYIAAWGVILGDIPQYFLSLVFNKILEDMRPGK